MPPQDFDLGRWAQLTTQGTPPRGNEKSLPAPPGPSAEQVVQHIVDWIRKTNEFHRPDNPPAWVGDEETWEKAKKAVEPYWDNYSEPYAVVAHVYENMGGGVK